MILLSDPRVAGVPVDDDGDPLVDLRDVPGLRLDPRAADPDGEYALLRTAVAARLLRAQASLPAGVRLLVIEGYRPPEAQLAVFTSYRDDLRRRHPSWTAARLHVETSKFAAPVEVAPHGTGGAVDVTLCRDDGAELDLGTAVDATPEASADACFTAATNVPAPARRNRAVLAAALAGAGLVNYPTEWWHWSYGVRYWALATGAVSARYGPVRPAAGTGASRDGRLRPPSGDGRSVTDLPPSQPGDG